MYSEAAGDAAAATAILMFAVLDHLLQIDTVTTL